MNKLAGQIDGDLFVLIFIAILVIAYFIYKEWPEFQRRVSKTSVKDKEDEVESAGIAKELEGIKKSIDELKESIDEIKEKQARDYTRLNNLDKETNRQKKALADSLLERKLLMKGILACLDGLEQQGCNHIVSTTKTEISTFLNDAAHADDNNAPDGIL